MSTAWKIAGAVTLLAFGVVIAGWQGYRGFLDTPLNTGDEGLLFEVRRGATMHSVVADLAKLGVTQSHWHWRLLTRLEPARIRAGEYVLKPGLKPVELIRVLASGAVVTYRFTIVEGWTFRQLRSALAADEVLIRRLAKTPDTKELLAAIDPGLQHPEGWFLPETYQYVRGDSDLDILKRAHAAMVAALGDAWDSRQDGLPLSSPYELLILASIVEKESALTSERPDIAGVFIRRLNEGWRLETDPTVIYGLGDNWDGDIRRRDLEADTPYNTYTRFGLPPTPIAMPGQSALLASAQPADGTAMFFVADGSGGHVFSDTLEQHNKAVRKMLSRRP
jgi:UPF0755 protein